MAESVPGERIAVDPFEDCLKKGRLKQIEPDAERVAGELAAAREEIERARSCYLGGNWDECATQAYFALYRCSRAAINSRGYRDTNLYGLCAAVEKLFVETEEMPREVIRQIKEGKDIKDAVYDGHRATQSQARAVLQSALNVGKYVFTKLSLPGFEGQEIETTIPEAISPDHERSRHLVRPQDPPPNPRRGEGWHRPRRY